MTIAENPASRIRFSWYIPAKPAPTITTSTLVVLSVMSIPFDTSSMQCRAPSALGKTRSALAPARPGTDQRRLRPVQVSKSNGGMLSTAISGPSVAPFNSRWSPLQNLPGSYQFGGRVSVRSPIRS